MLPLDEIAPERVRLLKRSEYEVLVDAGAFDQERVELLYGRVVEMSPTGAPHDSCIQRLNKLLVRAVGDRAEVRIQSSFLAANESQPQPDVAVVPPGSYHEAHPSRALLLVEVAASSLEDDRTLKARLYAESGVPEYWVVNLADRLIESHAEIVAGRYTRVTPYRAGERIQLRELPDVKLSVDDILPP
jgi:Uma2 family endonuclease